MKVKVNKALSKFLATKNTITYNIQKASEELQELSLILTQKLTKPRKTLDKSIIEEIGDVEIRLGVLKELFSKKQIQKRIEFKEDKFRKYIRDGKYKKQI